jgi:hypothetical protein
MSNPGHFIETAREPLEQISFCDILNHPGFSKNGESGYRTKHCKKDSSLPTKELISQLYKLKNCVDNSLSNMFERYRKL